MRDTERRSLFRLLRRALAGALALLIAGGVSAPSAAQRAVEATAASRTYVNPVYPHDFPDPYILRWRGKYYAYATPHPGGAGFQALESDDLMHWKERGVVFIPPWATQDFWAPEVAAWRGRFYLTYSALNPQTRRHDIGIAVADAPLGPFTQSAILVRADENELGVIDATLFVDDGTPCLIYSVEKPDGTPRRIVLRTLTSDLKQVVEGDKEPTVLMEASLSSDHDIAEAPTILKRNGVYHLFFSVGWFQSVKKDASYAVCHATAPRLRQRFTRSPEPLLATDTRTGQVYNPGHQSIVTLPNGDTWIAYHGWNKEKEPHYDFNRTGRSLRIERLYWNRDTPYTKGATGTPQAAPHIAQETRHVSPKP